MDYMRVVIFQRTGVVAVADKIALVRWNDTVSLLLISVIIESVEASPYKF